MAILRYAFDLKTVAMDIYRTDGRQNVHTAKQR